MTLMKEDTFICLDCEATGLDTSNDEIIEIASKALKKIAKMNDKP